MKTLALLIAGTIAATPALAQAAPDLHITGTRLDISASGESHRVPDVATISAGVVTQAPTAAKALAANATRMTATIAALKAAGVEARDIQTQSIRLSPQYRYDNNQPPVLTGYQANNSVSVRLRALDRAGNVLDALVAAGANEINGPSFGVDKPDAALDEARVEALAKARARAELYAKAAGLRVTRIAQISESENISQPIRPMAFMARAKSDSTPVEAGETTLGVTLQVTFELQ